MKGEPLIMPHSRTPCSNSRAVLVPAALLAGVGVAEAQPQYTVTPIAYPEAGAFIEDLNDAGQAPMDAIDTFGGDHNAFVWQNGLLTPQ